MPFFPMYIDLTDKKVLVVGGGRVALQKIKVLIEFEPAITVVADSFSSDFLNYISDKDINVLEKKFEDSDISDEDDYTVVVAATNNLEVNRRIYQLCISNKIPVNVVDNPGLCTFIFPSIYVNQNLVCSVSTAGESPVLTQYIKELLIKQLPANIGEISSRMGKIREKMKLTEPDMQKRKIKLRRILEQLIEDNNTTTEETISRISEGQSKI